jgi:hypothetical protein
LIFEFPVTHRQSFDDDIRAIRHIQAWKQTRTNLEFVHNAHRTVSLYAPDWGKSTQKNIGDYKARPGSRIYEMNLRTPFAGE